MSKQIDLTKPLSDEDRQYLVDRCRWEDLRTADADHPVPEPRDPNTTPPAQDTSPSSMPADVGSQTAELPTTPLPTDSVQAEAQFGNGEDGDNYEDRDVWSYSDLQEEAKTRTPSLSAQGSREEIVARLREDDEKDN